MKPQETLDYHFRKLWHGISRIYNAEAQKHDQTMSMGFALLSIEKDGTPSTHLGPRMGMEPRSLTRMIKNLEQRGYIEKKQDTEDRRIVKIYLTDEGNEVRKQVRSAVIKFNKHVQSKIAEDDLKTFFRVCNQLGDVIEENNIF